MVVIIFNMEYGAPFEISTFYRIFGWVFALCALEHFLRKKKLKLESTATAM